jgi:hypothetical protein
VRGIVWIDFLGELRQQADQFLAISNTAFDSLDPVVGDIAHACLLPMPQSMTKERRPAIQTLQGWAISVLQEAGAIRECEEHGWMQDRASGTFSLPLNHKDWSSPLIASRFQVIWKNDR